MTQEEIIREIDLKTQIANLSCKVIILRRKISELEGERMKEWALPEGVKERAMAAAKRHTKEIVQGIGHILKIPKSDIAASEANFTDGFIAASADAAKEVEREAIAFGAWLADSDFVSQYISEPFWMKSDNAGGRYSTSELYQIFRKETGRDKTPEE